MRDDPAARLALMARVFHGPTGRAPRHLPFRRAALSFMRWQARRGVLNPLDASPPGSVWWRAVNERLLRDGCETVALARRAGRRAVVAGRAALAGVRRETDGAQLVPSAQREHRGRLPGAPGPRRSGERAGALLHERRAGCACCTRTRSSRRRAWRWGGSLRSAACSAIPGSGWPECSSHSAACCPNRYPLALDVERYIADEQRLGRMLDYAVIVPRLQRLYEWSAEELGEPRLLELVRDGNPIYAWPFEQRHVWRTPDMPFAGRVLERVTRNRSG